MKPTTWPLRLQRAHDALLVRRRQLGEHDVAVSTTSASSASSMRSTSRAQQHTCRPPARLRGRSCAVTSSLSPVRILTATPCSASALSAGAVRFLRRVEEGDVADQRQVGFVGDAVGLLGRWQLLGTPRRPRASRPRSGRGHGRGRAASSSGVSGSSAVAMSHPACRRRASPRPRPCRSADGARRARSTTTDMRRRLKSNGISSTLR